MSDLSNGASASNNAENIEELRIATDRLGDQVSTLSLALQTVNYLQEQQQRVDKEMSETRAAAEEQRDLAGHLLNTLDAKASTADVAKLRLRTRRVAASAVLVSLLAAAGLSALEYEHLRVSRDLTRSCKSLQLANRVNREREAFLAANDAPITRAAHARSVQQLDQQFKEQYPRC